MSDTSKREELIEEAAKAMYFEDCGVAALEDEAEPFREMARVALGVFEQAHTPTEDAREAYLPADLYNRLQVHLLGSNSREALLLAGEIQSLTGASALRRTAVQEPSGFPAYFAPKPPMTTNRFASEPQGERAQARSERLLAVAEELGLARPEADFDIATGRPLAPEWWTVHHPEPQSEPTDAPTVQLAARRGGKVQAMIDSMLARADERGIRVEVVYPQGEPTDAQVEAALNSLNEHDHKRIPCYAHFDHYCCPCGEHGMGRSEWQQHQARAALRAAAGIGQEVEHE